MTMSHVYSTYEAKARLSELLRKVRAGQRVIIAHRGEPVAELRKVERPKTLADAVKGLEEAGALAAAAGVATALRPVARRRGALARFLASRE